ncbi:unnamed protein product, partial [Pleuronectes platessa]
VTVEPELDSLANGARYRARLVPDRHGRRTLHLRTNRSSLLHSRDGPLNVHNLIGGEDWCPPPRPHPLPPVHLQQQQVHPAQHDQYTLNPNAPDSEEDDKDESLLLTPAITTPAPMPSPSLKHETNYQREAEAALIADVPDRDTWQATTIAAKDQPAMITNVTTMDAMMGVSSVDHQNIGLKNVHYEGEVAEECEEDEVVDPMDISPRQIDLLDWVI